MEGGFNEEASNWEVYKDAFALPSSSRVRSKPWERAPVSAHAPRLQGQKIWKKTGLNRPPPGDQEDEDAAQMELERGGVGARKKARVVGEKENISDARWQDNKPRADICMNGFESPKKIRTSMIVGSPDKSLVIPRKRTNANHLITPRKRPSRRTAHTNITPTREGMQSPERPPRELHINNFLEEIKKSPGKSPNKLSHDFTQCIDESVGATQSSPHNPVRRTKPSRKSIQRLTSTDLPVQLTLTPVDQKPARSETVQEQVPICGGPITEKYTLLKDSNVLDDKAAELLEAPQKSPQKIPLNDAYDSCDAANVPQASREKLLRRSKSPGKSSSRITRSDVQQQSNATSITEVVIKLEEVSETTVTTIKTEAGDSELNFEPEAILKPIKVAQVSESFLAMEAIAMNAPQQIKELPLTLSEETGLRIQDEAAQIRKESVEPVSLPTLESDLLEETCEQATMSENLHTEPPSLEPQPFVFESVESILVPLSSSPIKPPSTPKGRKRSSSQRRGTRRSTRTTRASSIQLGAHPSEDFRAAEVPATQPLNDIKEPAASENDQDFLDKAIRIPVSSNATGTSTSQNMLQKAEEIELQEQGDTSVVQSSLVGFTSPKININVMEGTSAPEMPQEISVPPAEGIKFPVTEDLTDTLENVENDGHLFDIVTTVSRDSESSGEDTITETITTLFGAAEIEPQIYLPLLTDDQTVELSPISFSAILEATLQAEPKLDDASVEEFEVLNPISVSVPAENLLDHRTNETDELPETSTPNPSTTELVEAISENAPSATYDHDDTDMLRNFLSRVKANKEAKAKSIPKRKRSLPHSTLQLALAEAETDLSPSSSPKAKDEFDVSFPTASPTKRRKRDEANANDEVLGESKSMRRSGRTRLPIKAPVTAPCFIPVRRLGKDGDSTITLRRSEEKDLAALTRMNTRKNKGLALAPAYVLAKKSEKEDPAATHRSLKEAFDEKEKRGTSRKVKSVVWAKELARFQGEVAKKAESEKDTEMEKEKAGPAGERKAPPVRVGVKRSRTSLGMAVNGTPAPKRKMKGRP